MQLVERQPAPHDRWLQPQRGRRKGPQMRSRRREDELRASLAERHGVVRCRVCTQGEESQTFTQPPLCGIEVLCPILPNGQREAARVLALRRREPAEDLGER